MYSGARLHSIGSRFPEFEPELRAADNFVRSDTHIAFAKLRLILERVVRGYSVRITGQPVPEDATLQTLLEEKAFKALVPEKVLTSMHAVRMPANRVIHGDIVSSAEAAQAIERMLDILDWCSTWWRSSGTVARSSNSTGTPYYLHNPPPRSDSPTSSRIGPAAGVALAVGGVTVLVAALIWLYIASLDGLMNQQQRDWVQRTRQSPQEPAPPPNPPRAYVRNYPQSWPAPFFQEEIVPGAWGTWLEEPTWRHGGKPPSNNGDRDFIWYRSGEANGVQESNEWSDQCEDGDGSIRDVSAGHNEECEMSHRMRIRNDWHEPALVYYFAKRY